MYIKVKETTTLSTFTKSLTDIGKTIKKRPLLGALGAIGTIATGGSLLFAGAAAAVAKAGYDAVNAKPKEGTEQFIPWDSLVVETSEQQQNVMILNNTVVTFANEGRGAKVKTVATLLEGLASISGKITQETSSGEAEAVAGMEAGAEVLCSKCGTRNAKGAKFCGSCGEKLQMGCPNCGAPLEGGKKFCPECGAALIPIVQATIKCHQCGADVSPGKKFCSECGASL